MMSQLENSQRGAVLIVALVFMLILTIVGVAAMSNATLQERMAGNSKDVNIAFQAAEAAIREAEDSLGAISAAGFIGKDGLYLSCPDPDDDRQECNVPDWQDEKSSGWIVMNDAVPDVSRQPEYVIEQISAIDDPDAPLDADKKVTLKGYYRVIARGFGLNDRSMVVLVTTYKRVES